jgi:two-component system, OmpR family, lantibiotic biosynthesis response regulator NisR/SpaR
VPHTILIVDDDPDVHEMLRRPLSFHGYGVVSAANGWEALVAMDDHPVDAVLLDVLMPGMDGAKFATIVRRLSGRASMPIVVISVLSEQDVHERIGMDNVQGYAGKGDIRGVIDHLQRLLPPAEPIQTA